jgi:6-hydroxymethylpterin diphosphokinase MptE-like/Glycosyltransferase Maf N-terminal domain
MNFIEKLQSIPPGSRASCIEARYKKNREFFRKKYPVIDAYIEGTDCPYHIDLTENFLNIVHSESRVISHPLPLDQFVETLGDWNNKTWIDFNNFDVFFPKEKYPIHRNLFEAFHRRMESVFPEFNERSAVKQFALKDLADNKKYSPPVAFVGIFHGLHIEQYLSRTELDSAIFIEPEPERFEVSCYFLDWQNIEEKLGNLFLVLDADPNAKAIGNFFGFGRITPMIWLRVLPAYASSAIMPIISMLSILHNNAKNIFTPLDIDLQGMANGLENLEKKLPLLSARPKLSGQSQIAVVGAGPSLQKDLRWLKKNRKNLILFVVHSAVSALHKAGIRPDFQFALEMHLDEAVMERLELDSDVPLVLFYMANEKMIAGSKKTLLVGFSDRANVVELLVTVSCALPSTGSFAVAFALHFSPKRLYLLGLDLGFRKKEQRHVANENIYGKQEGKAGGDVVPALQSESLVQPNFTDTDPVWSNSFLTQTRINIETAIATHSIHCYNLADGASIRGAEACRSSNLSIGRYKKREYDCSRISRSFRSAIRGENWSYYHLHGGKVLERFLADFLQTVTLDQFDYLSFARAVDRVPLYCLDRGKDVDPGNRMECYFRIIMDWMLSWYRFMIFCETEKEGCLVYKEGLTVLRELCSTISWPEKLPADNGGEMLRK